MTKPNPADPKVKCIQRQKCEIVLLECRSRSENGVEGRPAERGRGPLAPALGYSSESVSPDGRTLGF